MGLAHKCRALLIFPLNMDVITQNAGCSYCYISDKTVIITQLISATEFSTFLIFHVWQPKILVDWILCRIEAETGMKNSGFAMIIHLMNFIYF